MSIASFLAFRGLTAPVIQSTIQSAIFNVIVSDTVIDDALQVTQDRCTTIVSNGTPALGIGITDYWLKRNQILFIDPTLTGPVYITLPVASNSPTASLVYIVNKNKLPIVITGTRRSSIHDGYLYEINGANQTIVKVQPRATETTTSYTNFHTISTSDVI